MYKQDQADCAANRTSYSAHIYNLGSAAFKHQTLDALPKEWSDLHRQGYIHIHELDAYGLTYNCLAFDFASFPYEQYAHDDEVTKVLDLFHYYQETLLEIGAEQCGGMSFPNFDNDTAEILMKLGVKDSPTIRSILRGAIKSLILFCNENRTRRGQSNHYTTLNIGLAKTPLAKAIASDVIDVFREAGPTVYMPNIVFKVKAKINRDPEDPNYDLLRKALLCTAEKMIPTYLLCDCEEDRTTDPTKLAIMGCRTRVVSDLYGCEGSIGRGNIANVSINLPRLALEVDRDERNASESRKVFDFTQKWLAVAQSVKDILLDRYAKTVAKAKEDYPTNLKRNLWCVPFSEAESVADVFKHGTLSIGFIGLDETVLLLSGHHLFDKEGHETATFLLQFMRDYCDHLRDTTQMNFSLLATSGELISGRFTEIDQKEFHPLVDIFSKGFYTNSFHLPVDSGVTALTKVTLEGPFHRYCNGGSISYVELGEAPLGNADGLDEILEQACKSGVHYLGFNFPLDICDDCGAHGVFDDECPVCHHHHITRIRRVSGYLEVLDGFTKGKKAEVKKRQKNDDI
jgi:anaerobic ribonucleoside-triphosphate reductase